MSKPFFHKIPYIWLACIPVTFVCIYINNGENFTFIQDFGIGIFTKIDVWILLSTILVAFSIIHKLLIDYLLPVKWMLIVYIVGTIVPILIILLKTSLLSRVDLESNSSIFHFLTTIGGIIKVPLILVQPLLALNIFIGIVRKLSTLEKR